ncbi:MAG: CxxxxCH/CxxCH domain c-type cytochrome [Trichloromonadaceae bacterium]
MRLATIFGLALLLLTASLAQARPVHFFDCKDCHTATVDLYALGSTNLCLKCHKDTPPAVTFNDGSSGHLPSGLFHPNDASDALNSATAAGMTPAPTQQTSHFWAGKKDAVPAAGALAPTRTLYTSRYGISTGKVTCTRCHDPHLPITTDPKLLRMTEAGDLICLDCHRPWKLSNNRGRETHPIVADYGAVAAANPTKYKPVVTNVGNGGVQLVGDGVSCSSCHGAHFADSHSGTIDGRDNRAGLLAGDGKLLRSDGPKRSGATAADTAQLRSNLCQACHTYKPHGDANPIGCLECHSGHSYNNGNPNYFVLRGSIASVYVPKNAAVGAVNNLQFTSATAEWMNAGGTGYCQNCHTLVAPHNGLSSGNGISSSCGECHYHGHAERSFTASCADCHGTPPTAAAEAPAAGGYAKSGSFDYFTSGFYKDESQTPHGNHAGGSDYRFSCDVCHLGKSHASGSFQDVFITPHALASDSGAVTPSYSGANSGTCSAVYCHSNGGKRTGDGTRSYKTLAVTWAGQKDSINSCDACHGNSALSMQAANRDNSSSHQKHLAKGYDCSVCHANTATSATALVGGAIGTTHVNGSADVSFDNSYELSLGRPLGAGSYASVAGTCSIYCHSNGQGANASPDWDLAASGACGSCHGARPGDGVVIASGSHSKHVSAVNGPQLSCDACHGANANSGAHAGHVNGMVNAPAASVCTGCHAVDGGEISPVWGNPATSTCESCHGGATVSVIGGKTAPTKPMAASSGHNKPIGNYSLSGKLAANKTCVACHDAEAAGHFGASGDSRLSVGFSCSSCHSSVLTHQAKACVACHDPHGTSNGYMIYSTQAAQNAKDASLSGKFSGNVVFTAKTGADSYDELDAGVGANADDLCASCHSSANGTSHNNREVSGPAHHEGTNCTSCHAHAKAFRPVGTACNQCHGNAPATGAHAFHVIVGGHTAAEDRTDCAVCHIGADNYTYDPSADMAGGLNHGDAAGRKTKLTTAVGFSVANQTCASACHKSSVGDGAWGDADGLACDSCHYWSATPTLAGNNAYINASGAAAPLSAKHSKHFALSMTCGNCHGTVTTDLTFKRDHNNFKNAATDADKIRYQGYGFLNPTGTGVLVDDRSFNGAVNSWVNSAVTNDGGNTCANAACHNPSKTTYKADWDSDVASCNLCHSATDPATGAHGKHLTSRGAVYGGNVACSTCHVDNGVNMAHRNGTVNLRSIPKSANCHSCHIQPPANCNMVCHTGASGLSNVWQKTGVVTGCASCHVATPTSGAHTGHISAAYGPLTGSDCSACHQSQANNTSMSGIATHMNLTVTLRNRAVPASPYEVTFNTIGQAANDAVDSCNACHGGAAAALLAKDYWTTATRVSCESCHGITPATRNADGTGVVAPIRTTNYTTKGHGKGGVTKACMDCHDNAAAHISGILDDANRIKTLSAKNYDVAAQRNDWCNGCHASALPPHYANNKTAGGTSDDGIYCSQCHDPHGNSGYDAMVAAKVGNNHTIAAFSDRTNRASYVNASFNGVCQVCHDSEVSYFNRSKNETHYAGNCLSCHKHNDTEAFKPSGCNGCHGDATAGNFWPDNPSALSAAFPDRLGSHLSHVNAIGQQLGGAGWADMNAAQRLPFQNATCNYCHPNPGGTNRDGAGHDVNTLETSATISDMFNDGKYTLAEGKFKNLSGTDDLNGSYNSTIKRCSNIYCHSNGDFTWTWYPDVMAPGKVTTLVASTGSEVGTVNLNWSPPPNDEFDGPVGYGYEVRYSTSGAITDGNWASATIAGGPPAMVRTYPDKPRTQTMTVRGLTPGITYWFAVKAFDETVINKSLTSNSVSLAAKTDTVAPFFTGLQTARPAMSQGKVNLTWTATSDDSEPITYRIWWAPASGTINFDALPNASTTAAHHQVVGLSDGVNYKFAVRAEDAVGNRNTNTIQKEAIPQSPTEKDWLGVRYFGQLLTGHTCGQSYTYSGTGTLAGALGTATNPCSATVRTRLEDIRDLGEKLIWRMPSAVGQPTNIIGGSLNLYLRESDEVTGGQNIRVHLGYTTDGTNYTSIGSIDRNIPGGHRGNLTVGLSTLKGDIPGNGRVVLKIEKIAPNATNKFELRYGSDRYQMFFTLFQQPKNNRPGAFAVSTPSGTQAGSVPLSWGPVTDSENDPLTYDVYGSIDNGATYPFIIGTGLKLTTATWNTSKDGIALTAAVNARFKVEASDGLNHNESGTLFDRQVVTSNTFSIDNSNDTIPPAAITDLHAEHRPKNGTVWLYWHAPGDDGQVGKARTYDIRYSTANITDLNFGAAVQVDGEPVPSAPGLRQGFEVLGLNPGQTYYFAMKSADEKPNWSPLSNVVSAAGGLRCGVCHSTPPDDLATSGTHDEHGFTQTDCAKCHGQEAETFGLNHGDGVIRLGWNNAQKLKDFGGSWNPALGPVEPVSDTSVLYRNQHGTTIYSDTTGGGGYNNYNPATGDNRDNGTCSGFNASGVTGCHGTGTPIWDSPASVSCAMCHGDPNRANVDPYGRPWEDQTADTKYANAAKIYKSAPSVDLQGQVMSNAVGQHQRHLNFSYRLTGDQCKLCHLGNDHADGTVNVKMHSSAGEGATWNPPVGANPGTCGGTSELRCHGNNATVPPWKTRDVEPTGTKLVECNECHGHQRKNFSVGAAAASIFDRTATVTNNWIGDGVWTTLTINSGHNLVAGNRIEKGKEYLVVQSSATTSVTFTAPPPNGMIFTAAEVLLSRHIPHTLDGGVVRPCTWCHVEGHPQGASPAGDAVVMVPNYAIVGIDYTSGGIHLRKNINSRGVKDTEAEICWTCHDAQTPRISEWGTNIQVNTGSSPYDYGTLHNNSGAWGSRTTTSNWVGAYWDSPNFRYKTAQIQSTHSVNPEVTGPGVDAVAQIRCSYCHDVHDMNLARGDAFNGKPFLRGTWMGNPYKEDGAPGRNESFRSLASNSAKVDYYPYNNDFGAVPRGALDITKLGGYWIDQNSGYPTLSWTLSSSAGLCTLCHGTNIDTMDHFGTNDWIGTNGHSNAAIGGTGVNKADIYKPADRKEGNVYNKPGMGYAGTQLKTAEEMFGLRNYQGDTPSASTDNNDFASDTSGVGVAPYIWSTDTSRARYAFGEFAWGLDRTAGAIDHQYHRFSCSKCHNPHASRLPRLMITNCLDVSHTKWDDLFAGDPDWTNGNSDGTTVNWSTSTVMPYTGNDISGLARNRQYAYATSAQNCHRYVDTDSNTATDNAQEKGWNKVTPWNEPSKTFYDNN